MNPGLKRYAVLTATMTLLLILAGGFVTTTATGDTITGWPFMWGKISAGFPIEWTHRVLAAIVATLVAGLMFWTLKVEERPWVRKLAVIAFAGVMAQALLGGLRIFLPKAAISITHACFAQVVFCAVTSIAFFMSDAWKNLKFDDAAGAARKLGVVTTVFAFLQLVAGAVTRHTGAGIAVHLIGAALVLIHVTLFASKLALTPLKKGANILLLLIVAQVVLGLGAWSIKNSDFVRSFNAPIGPIVTVTSHVAVGAMVLASCLLLTLGCFRSFRSEAAPELKLENA